MAITGIDTIDGKQIIAAGAVSSKSAEMAYNDENGNPITGYQVAGDYYSASNPSGFITGLPEEEEVEFEEIDLNDYQSAGDYYSASNPSGFITGVPAGTMNENSFGYDSNNKISSYNGSAFAGGGGGGATYGYTNNGLISSIDTSGLYATSGSANHLNQNGTMGKNITQSDGVSNFLYMPNISPWKSPTGIFSPLQYATGACLAMAGGGYAAYFKGNEWYVSNSGIGQMLRGEVHRSRGVHVSGATTAGNSFDLNISGVSGNNDTANNYNWKLERGYVSGNGAYGSWKYGYQEDAALRDVSSCDMHESAFEYDANDKISGYNGSAFAGGSDVPEGVMVESGLEYNAVDEISGYNGSAIAQYGAEKQWLVHDDTLVHASNSAQYALGVNVSAIANLVGAYPISITESGSYTLDSTYVTGTSYLNWYYLSNGMCRIKGQLRPSTSMPAAWHVVQIASNGASALLDGTFIPTVIDWEGWADYLTWFSNGTMQFNSREVSPTANNRLIYVDYLGIPKR